MPVSEPVLTPPGAGESAASGRSRAEITVDSRRTGGDYGVVRYTVASGEEPPLHTHSREDEIVLVLEGELIARVGDARVTVGPGAMAALPRGVPHGIEVTTERAVLLLTFVPGGLERFFVPPAGGTAEPAAFGLEMHGPVAA